MQCASKNLGAPLNSDLCIINLEPTHGATFSTMHIKLHCVIRKLGWKRKGGDTIGATLRANVWHLRWLVGD